MRAWVFRVCKLIMFYGLGFWVWLSDLGQVLGVRTWHSWLKALG